MKIIETQGKHGTKIYSSIDEVRGVPYCGVFINQGGDYWFTVYGALSFKRSDHDRILEKCSPIGKKHNRQIIQGVFKMICTNKLVFDWYKQTKAGVIPAMFKAAHLRERLISVHEVVNANGYKPQTAKQLELNNTMALIRLWRKRAPLWEILTFRHSEKHAATMARLNRRHLKACNRK